MSLPPELTFQDGDEVDAALFARVFGFLHGQVRAALALKPDVDAALLDLQANGLARIAASLAPVYDRAVEIDAHLQELQAAYLGEGVIPAILAQAATAADAKVHALDTAVAQTLAGLSALYAVSYAAKLHQHGIGDIAGLADALAGKRSASVELYATGGTWTKPVGLTAAYIITIGGGGGGGAGCSTAGVQYYYGGVGGGGGGFSALMVGAHALGATESIQIGAGGLGGAATDGDGNPGLAGGTSSFGTLIRASGGSPGAGGFSSGGGPLPGGEGGRGLYAGGAGSGVANGSNQTTTPASLPAGFAAGGGGCGAFGSFGAAVAPTIGSICFPYAGTGPTLATGIAAIAARHGGGGGGGGDVRQRGFDGGGPGGGGGGGGTGGFGNGGGASTGGPAGAGGNGAAGAVFILNIF